MIRSLYIKNFALIKELNLQFLKGYTVLTGETGSGKSILIEALFFLFGKKGETKVIRDGENKAIIEAEFEWPLNKELNNLLSENQISSDLPILIRREINLNGRSRAFINDTLVNNNLLKQISQPFIDIHTQHELLDLLKPKQQLDFIDSFAENGKLLNEFKLIYKSYVEVSNKIENLIQSEKKAALEKDFFQFLFEELEQSQIQPNEETNLENEWQSLLHAEDIMKGFSAITHVLQDNDISVLSQINQLEHIIEKPARYHKSLTELSNRLKSVYIELKDVVSEAELLFNNTELNPDRKNQVEARLNKIQALLHKHQVTSCKQLLEKQQELKQKLQNIVGMGDMLLKLQTEQKETYIKLEDIANSLSENRKKAAQKFQNQVSEIISELAMPFAKFEVVVNTKETFSETGINTIVFNFNANKGGKLKPLSEIASGGELSRVLLAIKTIIAGKNNLQTVIFDEIDTGVSGEIAHKFGLLFKQMSNKIQVFAISHLPQVAAQANNHLAIKKAVIGNETITQVNFLTDCERVTEIAKLISTDKLTDASIQNAKAMLHA